MKMYLKVVLCALLVQCALTRSTSKNSGFIERVVEALEGKHEKRACGDAWGSSCASWMCNDYGYLCEQTCGICTGAPGGSSSGSSGGNTGGNTGGSGGNTGGTGGNAGGNTDGNSDLSVCSGPGNKLTQSAKDSFVAEHNRIRGDVGVGGVVWDDNLAQKAQVLADARPSCTMGAHEYGDCGSLSLGQNLFAAAGYGGGYQHATAADAMKKWESEKPYLPSSRKESDCRQTCGHYSQIVWAKTTKIGCAGRSCTINGWLKQMYVCDYYPRGNMNGEPAY